MLAITFGKWRSWQYRPSEEEEFPSRVITLKNWICWQKHTSQIYSREALVNMENRGGASCVGSPHEVALSNIDQGSSKTNHTTPQQLHSPNTFFKGLYLAPKVISIKKDLYLFLHMLMSISNYIYIIIYKTNRLIDDMISLLIFTEEFFYHCGIILINYF